MKSVKHVKATKRSKLKILGVCKIKERVDKKGRWQEARLQGEVMYDYKTYSISRTLSGKTIPKKQAIREVLLFVVEHQINRLQLLKTEYAVQVVKQVTRPKNWYHTMGAMEAMEKEVGRLRQVLEKLVKAQLKRTR